MTESTNPPSAPRLVEHVLHAQPASPAPIVPGSPTDPFGRGAGTQLSPDRGGHAQWGCPGIEFFPRPEGKAKVTGPFSFTLDAAVFEAECERAIAEIRAKLAAAVEGDERVKQTADRLAQLNRLRDATEEQLAVATKEAENAADAAKESLHRAEDPAAFEQSARDAQLKREQLQARIQQLAPLIGQADALAWEARRRVDGETRWKLRAEAIARWFDVTRPIAEAFGRAIPELASLQAAVTGELQPGLAREPG